jgi:hypothetical protein
MPKRKYVFALMINHINKIEGGIMAAIVIGRVKSGKGKSYEVKWDQSSRDVYVSYAGWTHVGKASSAREAMNKTEAWLYNK